MEHSIGNINYLYFFLKIDSIYIRIYDKADEVIK